MWGIVGKVLSIPTTFVYITHFLLRIIFTLVKVKIKNLP